MQKFSLLNSTFIVDKLGLSGPVIFSEEALYLIPLSDIMAEVNNPFGPIGFLFQWWSNRTTDIKIDHSLSTAFVDLPAEVTNHAGLMTFRRRVFWVG